jgi:hypothetical protein
MERTDRMNRGQVLKGAVGLGVAGVLLGPRAAFGGGDNALYRWDIVNLGFPEPLCAEEGGDASSKSQDGARITVTGSGTFRDNGGVGHPQNVTGGGTYKITAGSATPAQEGTFEVVHFVSFDVAPGTLPIADCIGNVADARAGRMTVAVRYSDGSDGILELGCHLDGSPDSIMEGITATKGFVTFWNHEQPAPGVEGNRTLFHRLS